MTNNTSQSPMVVSALFLSAGIAAAGYFSGMTAPTIEMEPEEKLHIVAVKGIAERDVVADAAVWEIRFTTRGENIKDLYKSAKMHQEAIVQQLVAAGFKAENISRRALPVKKTKQMKRKKAEAIDDEINSSVTLRTTNVNKVKEVEADITALLEKDIMITRSTPEYLYTKLYDIREEMITEATKNARATAEKVASSAGVEIEKVHSLHHGNVALMVRDNESRSKDHYHRIEKKARMAATLQFTMED